MGKGASTTSRPPLALPGGEEPQSDEPDDLAEKLLRIPFHANIRRAKVEEAGFDSYEWLDAADEPVAREEAFVRLLHGFEHAPTGMRVDVPPLNPDATEPGEKSDNPRMVYGQRWVRATVSRHGEPVGLIALGLERDPEGDFELRIGQANWRGGPLPENGWNGAATQQHLGQGFGRAWHDELVRRAQDAGVERITLNAVGLGAYAWARFGYRFDPRTTSLGETAFEREQSVANTCLRRLYADPSLTDAERHEVEYLQRKKHVLPIDIAQIGRARILEHNPTAEVWPGVNAMSSWYGVYYL